MHVLLTYYPAEGAPVALPDGWTLHEVIGSHVDGWVMVLTTSIVDADGNPPPIELKASA